MRLRAPLAIVSLIAAGLMAVPARAERLIVSVSNHRVTVTPNYSGGELVLFGSVEKDDKTPANRGNYDLAVTVSGPRADMVTRRKERRFGIWINTDSRQFLQVPGYLALFSNRPVRPDRLARRAAPPATRAQQRAADAAGRPRLCRRGAERSVPQRLRAAAHRARALPRGDLRGDVPDPDPVPHRHSAAGRGADRHLQCRDQVVFRRRAGDQDRDRVRDRQGRVRTVRRHHRAAERLRPTASSPRSWR